MPWDTKNFPASMKNLSEQERAKAISIANAILREGGSEGIAIATGIKKAKELEKVANSEFDKIKYLWNYGKSKNIYLLPLAGSATFGGWSYLKTKDKKYNKASTVIGALSGAYLGANLHLANNTVRYAREKFRSKPGFSGFQPEPTSFIKKYNFPHKEIKTKLEAKKYHTALVKRFHPDANPGIDPDKMKELNNDWEAFQQTNYFNKLASIAKKMFHQNITIPVGASLVAGGLVGSALPHKDNKTKYKNIAKSALGSGIISYLFAKHGLKKHVEQLKSTISVNKDIDNRFQEAYKSYMAKHASKENHHADEKAAISASIISVANPMFKNKERLLKLQKYVEVPDHATKTFSYDLYEPALKNKMLKKIKILSYAVPAITGGLTYGVLKTKRKFFGNKESGKA